MKDSVLSALEAIPAADLSLVEWLGAGMELKAGGYPRSVWEAWSRGLHSAGECESLWNGFREDPKAAGSGTILRMAKKRGWQPPEGEEGLGTEEEDGGLPEIVSLDNCGNEPKEPAPELIRGILRMGHKMLISGSSKSGKSFLLMELCIAIAEGTSWLGFPCRQGRVLYINLEIDPASCFNRFLAIYRELGLEALHRRDILIWNLRGYAVPLEQLAPKVVDRVRNRKLCAIIFDPLYKIISGDENSAGDMGRFCNQFDRICTATGCAVICAHHHSKGTQGKKRAIDRASGSGVFARDPDAQLDIIELELSEEIRSTARNGNATGWRLESSLREFPNIRPVNFWFEYPVHRVDSRDALAEMPAQGSLEAGRMRNRRFKSTEEVLTGFRRAFDDLTADAERSVTVKEMAAQLGVTTASVYNHLKKLGKEFNLKKGVITRAETGLEADEREESKIQSNLYI